MIFTPFLFRLAPRIAGKSKDIITDKPKDKISEEFQDHVIVAGFGLNGRNLTHVLKETGIKHIIIEMNPDTVKKEKAKGSWDQVQKCVKIARMANREPATPEEARKILNLPKRD